MADGEERPYVVGRLYGGEWCAVRGAAVAVKRWFVMADGGFHGRCDDGFVGEGSSSDE